MKTPKQLPVLSDGERKSFWSKVAVGLPESCWPWLGSATKEHYGYFAVRGRCYFTSRLSYLMATGHDPLELFVLHSCDNPPCCNPKHLRAGTQKENGEDMALRKRCPDRRGSKSNRAKLSDVQVDEILRRAKHEKHADIAKELGISRVQVTKISCGLAWTHKQSQ